MASDTFKTAHERVRSLVADFRRHEAHYLSAKYQEQDVRKDFITTMLTHSARRRKRRR